MGATTQKTETGTGRNKTFFFLLFVAGLALSLILHVLFLKKACTWMVRGFSAGEYDRIVPRTFHMERVEIDPKTLEASPPSEPSRESKTKESPAFIDMEKPSVGEKEGASGGKPLLEKPKEADLHDINTPLTEDQTGKGNEALLPKLPDGREISGTDLPGPGMTDITETGGNAPGAGSSLGNKPGYSSLDELLSGTGKVTPQTAPILMPTDLLFEYDSAQLRPDAAQALEKLGTLIERNAGSSFRIEGHTDSFGSDQYNERLSLRRAEAVKEWLHGKMGIDASRITTSGLGKAHLLVPGTGTVGEQQLNRRVEIVILSGKP